MQYNLKANGNKETQKLENYNYKLNYFVNIFIINVINQYQIDKEPQKTKI